MDAHVKLTENVTDTQPDELSTGYSAVSKLSNREMTRSFGTKMIIHHLFNQMCHLLTQVHQLMIPVDPPSGRGESPAGNVGCTRPRCSSLQLDMAITTSFITKAKSKTLNAGGILVRLGKIHKDMITELRKIART